ncbi:MAG: phosphoglycerate kinase [archaeon]
MSDYLRTIKDIDLNDKIIFLRTSYDLPLDSSKDIRTAERIKDDSRIRDSIPTIKYILGQRPAKLLIAAGWMGRPKGEDTGLTMAPAVLRLQDMLDEAGIKTTVRLAPDCLDGSAPRSVYRNQDEVKKTVDDLGKGEVLIFENARFDKEANKGDPGFARFMASLAGKGAVYVNEAEAQNHRPEGTVKLVPGFIVEAGGDAVFGLKYFRVMESIGGIGKTLKQQDRGPFVFFLSGKKIEVAPGITSKITVTHKLLDSMREGDTVVVQGAVTYTFLLAKEWYDAFDQKRAMIKTLIDEHHERLETETEGKSSDEAAEIEVTIQKEKSEAILEAIGKNQDDIKALIGGSYRKKGQEGEQVFFAYDVIAKAKEHGVRVQLAVDHCITDRKPNKQGILPDDADIKVYPKATGIPDGWMAVGPGPQTVRNLKNAYAGDGKGISLQAGPLQIEDRRVEGISKANTTLGEILREVKAAGWTTIAAGGDTASETTQWNNEDAFSVISSAGGATLELMQSGTSVGAEAIRSAVSSKKD